MNSTYTKMKEKSGVSKMSRIKELRKKSGLRKKVAGAKIKEKK